MMKKFPLYEHKVQYYETDQMGVVHHSNYIRWFEESRVNLMDNMGAGYDEMEKAGIISPVLEAHAQYKTMTKFGDTVTIETKMASYSGIKMTIAYEVRDKITGEVCCTGETKHCFIDGEGKLLSLKKKNEKFHQMFQDLLEM